MLTLNAQKRTTEKPDLLRMEGRIPAVMYGRKTDSQALSIDTKEFIKLYREAGESTIFTLSDGEETHDALIHDIDIHPVSHEPLHVDFYIVEKGQVLTVTVPLEFVGEAPIAEEGAQIVTILHEIEVESKPQDLPQSIEVDLSVLTSLDSVISIKDLSLPKGVIATADPEEVVITVSEAVEEVEPEETGDLSQVEVEKKGKAEESEE